MTSRRRDVKTHFLVSFLVSTNRLANSLLIGVLQRHESLAANLGAKLVGPLLLKSFEKLFEGPIKTLQSSYVLEQSPISWLDVVTFARTNPAEFNLSENSPGMKTSRFWIKGGQVEITEDDFRLIMSRAPERMIPTLPIPEDESAELATLNILEGRLAMLIKRADAVASKARQLNYHLKGRKTAVIGRKAVNTNSDAQPFSAINRSSAPPNGEAGQLQQQLLEHFLSLDRRQILPSGPHTHPRPKVIRVSTANTDHGPDNFQARFNGDSSSSDSRRTSHPPPGSSEDAIESHYKIIMAGRLEKLSRGDRITPPCDRCRRLRFECTKHLTACQACTKKHAKCSWKDIREHELDAQPAPPGRNAFSSGNANGSENGGFVVDTGGVSEGLSGSESHHESAAAQRVEDSSKISGWTPVETGSREKEKDRERQENLVSEAAMLSQIANAAAAATR